MLRNPDRPDPITALFAGRRTRRGVISGGRLIDRGPGFGQIGDQRAASAEDASPAAPPDGDAQFLFVQSFAAGRLSPKEAEADAYVLELSDHIGQTVYFSDRPQRLVGTVPTALFLEGLGFTPANPPNAALVAATGGGDEEILVVELFDPRYDEKSGALTYDVRLLAGEGGVGMTFQREALGAEHPGASYGASHLFIDDCPTYHGACHRPNQAPQDLGCVSFCWVAGVGACQPCRGVFDACCADQPSGQCDVTYTTDDVCP